MDFPDWLDQELARRGWKISHLSRRSGLAHSTISDVIHRRTSPGAEFCIKVAAALNTPPDQVFRQAGMLPPLVEGGHQKELLDYFQYLTEEDRDTIVRMARSLYERRAEYALRKKEDEP